MLVPRVNQVNQRCFFNEATNNRIGSVTSWHINDGYESTGTYTSHTHKMEARHKKPKTLVLKLQKRIPDNASELLSKPSIHHGS